MIGITHEDTTVLGRVRRAIDAIAAGRPVVVLDDEERENEGDLVFAAELATPELMSFLVRYSSGFVCVALPAAECDRLDLPPIRQQNQDPYGTAYRVTVDAVDGTTTGISGRDRARTARILADASAGPADFSRPGHVVPLAAKPGGTLSRPGHTEASVDLARLAGLRPAGVLCEVVSQRDPVAMARGPELAEFAARHELELISIAELIAYRRLTEPQVVRADGFAHLPTTAGQFRTVGYREVHGGGEQIALVAGDIGSGRDVLVHVHTECFLGDVFGSQHCECARRLDIAMRRIAHDGRGVVVYVRGGDSANGHERGVHRGLDVSEIGLGRMRVASRVDECAVAADILRDLGARSIRLVETSHIFRRSLQRAGFDIGARLSLTSEVA